MRRRSRPQRNRHTVIRRLSWPPPRPREARTSRPYHVRDHGWLDRGPDAVCGHSIRATNPSSASTSTVTIDDEGKVHYSIAYEITDPKGKHSFQEGAAELDVTADPAATASRPSSVRRRPAPAPWRHSLVCHGRRDLFLQNAQQRLSCARWTPPGRDFRPSCALKITSDQEGHCRWPCPALARAFLGSFFGAVGFARRRRQAAPT